MARLRYLEFLPVGLCWLALNAQAAEPGLFRQSATGMWAVQVLGRTPAINQIESRVVEIHDANGDPVEHASIRIGSAMPEHQHGMLTTPVARELGQGRYQLDGLRFHMHGWWQLWLRIEAENKFDHVSFDLRL